MKGLEPEKANRTRVGGWERRSASVRRSCKPYQLTNVSQNARQVHRKVRRAESTGRLPAHYERKGEALLALVLAAFVDVVDPTDGVAAHENDPRQAHIGVELGGQRG